MSLSWRDRYVAVVGPERVSLVRRRRWGGAVDLKLDARHDAHGESCAAALAGLLARPEVGRGELCILLSSHFVRYLLVPWSDELGSPEEFEAYARICFEQIYGGATSAWAFQVSLEPAGRARLTAAIEQRLLDGLRTAGRQSRLRLVSIQPYLAAAFNRLGARLRGRDFLFVLAEPARTCLLAVARGRWSGVATRAGEDSPQALAQTIEREAQLLGLDPASPLPIYVHAPQRARISLPAVNGVMPQALSLPIPGALAAVADDQLAMAMAAA